MAKKTTELVLVFYKKKSKLVFLWPNIGQKSIKVLIYDGKSTFMKFILNLYVHYMFDYNLFFKAVYTIINTNDWGELGRKVDDVTSYFN